LALQETPEFAAYVRSIREIFEANGVLDEHTSSAVRSH
jgi:hypothetical protein